MLYTTANAKRKIFSESRALGNDDEKIPQFYNALAHEFKFSSKNSLIFIVVAHLVHSLPYFLELITQLGKVAAIIPKESNYVDSVKNDIQVLYQEWIEHGLNKKILRENPEITRTILTRIFNDPANQHHQFIILDHGGYFAPCLNILLENPIKIRLSGIVEHTWNGELRYQTYLQENNIDDFPIFSIARSRIKAQESRPVAQSFIAALIAIIYGGSGLNQDFYRLKNITIVGFGNLGKEIAFLLSKLLEKTVNIKIYDCSFEAIIEAKKFGFLVTNELESAIASSDLIITATSDIAIRKEHIEAMESNACLACVTSRDDQLAEDLLINFDIKNCSNSVSAYQHKENKKIINVASHGASVNYLIGSTAHPIIHAVLGAACVAAVRCYEIQKNKTSKNSAKNMYFLSETDNTRLEQLYEQIFNLEN